MASTAGLVFVLEKKNGFIDKEGNITKNIEDARRIGIYEFGWGKSAYKIYKELGFTGEYSEDDINIHTVEPSYDSRLGTIENMLIEMGERDYFNAMRIAHDEFIAYSLQNFENYQRYIKNFRKRINNFYEKQETYEKLVIDDETINFKLQVNSLKDYNDYSDCILYSPNKTIYKHTFYLMNPHVEKYFNMEPATISYFNNWQNEGLYEHLVEKLKTFFKDNNDDPSIIKMISQDDNTINVYSSIKYYNLEEFINETIRDYYESKEMHITRMFGSYILLIKENGELKAIHATPIPIKYCPLMYQLLKEISGNYAFDLLKTIKTGDIKTQEKCMCNLINETVIKSRYFDTNRPLNSCEANVLFGASETMSSALKNGLIDAAVIVSNNLGTIITTNAKNTQGAVKRMTGLFYTTASKDIVKTAKNENIIPVFPYTGKIDQIAGVKLAIKRGFKKIAVSVAAGDNYLHEELKKLETDDIKIYKFGLCSTGISKETTEVMKDYADVIWSCASKYVKEIIEPNAIAQVGIKIPVHIMSKEGFEIVKNHLMEIYNKQILDEEISLTMGDDKPIFLNQKGNIKVLSKKQIHDCNDCPHPCI